VRIPLAEIGRRAAARLLKLVDSDDSPATDSELVPAELIVRSTG
jgi:DNA-binding LacI/PurR family transcriptional regulator